MIRELVKNADGKFSETPDITLGRRKLKAELIPPALIVARFFAAEQAALEALEARAEEAARAVEELDEEHGGEDGLLFDAKTDKGKLTAKSVKDRARDIRADKDAGEERAMLKTCAALIEAEAEASKAVKEAQAELDAMVVAQYAKLSDAEVKVLLVEDKWLAQVRGDVLAEVDRVSQALAGRVKVLAERYATPLPKLAEDRRLWPRCSIDRCSNRVFLFILFWFQFFHLAQTRLEGRLLKRARSFRLPGRQFSNSNSLLRS